MLASNGAASDFDVYASYLNLGLSVLPLASSGDTKAPNHALLPRATDTGKPTYKHWQERLATPKEVEHWKHDDLNAGVGILCGYVSGGPERLCLVGIDIDSPAFSQWIEANHTEDFLKRTWVVRTGSGKLHIYLRSKRGAVSYTHLRAHETPE